MKNRKLGIYFFFDEKGIARDFTVEFVKGLKNVCTEVCIVVNGKLTDESYAKFKTVVDNVWIRKNIGFDVWAYKEMIAHLGWEYVRSFNELVLCNFTCYGPVYPFNEMFDKMEKKECDFWGAVKHPEQPVYLLPNKKGYIHEHLMSYFIVVRERMLKSEDFKLYWECVPEINTKRESTAYHETVFTKHFEDLGYKSDAYVDLERYKNRCFNSSIILANELLIKDRCPLVKRRAFIFPEYEGLLNISISNQSVELMDYINNNTEYDANLIWDDMLQTQKMSLLHNNMHLTNVFSSMYSIESKKQVCLCIYLASKLCVDLLVKHIESLVRVGKVVLLYADDEIAGYAKEILEIFGIKEDNLKKVEIISNRVTLDCIKVIKEDVKGYDYTCCIFNYNIVKQSLQITEEDYISYTYSTLFENVNYINNIIARFESQPRLGLMVPAEATFSAYYGQNIARNKHNMKNNLEIYDKLGFSIPFDDGDFYNNQSAFWVRKEVLEEVNTTLEDEKKYKTLWTSNTMDFFLPMFVQDYGYYVATTITEKLASVNITHNNYMKKYFLNIAEKTTGQIYWRYLDMINNSLKKERVVVNESKIMPSRDEIVNTQFSFKEVLNIVKKYPKNWNSYRKSKKNTKQAIDAPVYTYLRNVSIENERLVLYFMCGNKEINTSYVMLNGRKYYAKKELTEAQKDLVKYVADYSKAYAVFFEIPLDVIKNQLITLHANENKQIFFKWASGVSYNALELKKLGLYSRIASEGYYIQTKKEYINGIIKSSEYTAQDKKIFKRLIKIKNNNVTLMSENLGAADNTYQLFKYCVEQGENVYFIVSQQVYDSMPDSVYKERVVVHNSDRHIELIQQSCRWITSFSLRGELFPTNNYFKDIHYNMMDAKWIFIPHGMAIGDKKVSMLYKYAWDNPDTTYASSKAEAEAYANIYGFQNVTYLGSPRMDKWENVKINENEIFMFFTWRMGMSKGRTSYFSKFEESPYYKTIVKIVENVRRKYPNYKINYAFHHEIVKCGYDANIKEALKDQDVDFIYLNNNQGIADFNERFGSSKYLITDFSSVAFDFAYKKDGISIYYLEDDFISYHYELNDVFYEQHLGVVARNVEELLGHLKTKKVSQTAKSRRQQFFYDMNGGNAQRVYNAIFKGNNPSEVMNTNISKKDKGEIRRLGIYFFFDPDGIVDDYVYYYLDEFKKNCQEVCVVVNGSIRDEYKEKLINTVDKVIVRENIGFDSWAYKEAIRAYGYDYIADNYDELVLNNFTNFGPVYPFEEMFEVMSNKECDFWGHNRYLAMKGQRFDDVEMVDHLQSYFTVFRKTILKSKYFKKYWEELQCPTNYIEAIKFHEIRYTKYFEELGYISKEFIPYGAYDASCNNAPLYMAYSQVAEHKSPLLKRKIFFTKDGMFEFPVRDSQSIPELIEYIKTSTNYDVKLILQNISRTQNLEEELTKKEKDEISQKYKSAKNGARNIQEIRKANAEKNKVYDKEKFFKSFE